MSPVLNCVPSSPPLDQDTFTKTKTLSLNGSNVSLLETSPSQRIGDLTESETSSCDDVRTGKEDSKRSSPINNNNTIPLNFKKSPSPHDGLAFETPIRPWNSSPNFRSVDRGQSVSPSNSSHRPSPCPRNSISPDVSSDNSRIPSQASSEAHDSVISSDHHLKSPKICPELPCDMPFPFQDNRISSDSFRLSNSFLNDPVNPYFRLPSNPLNPFHLSTDFLASPFLGTADPKLLQNYPNLGFISQQLHHLNGLSSNMYKTHPSDLHRMSVQQLQLLQNHLQTLPTFLQPSPYAKFTDHKTHFSMLIQTRKPKTEAEPETLKKEVYPSIGSKSEDSNKVKERKLKPVEATSKNRKKSIDEEGMEIDNYKDNNSDSDELLSVGSASPPPNNQPIPDAGGQSNACVSSLNGSPSTFPNRTLNSNSSKKYSNAASPVKLQNSLKTAKNSNASNRTLKFSIDNILKSDFGNEDLVKEPKPPDTKKQKDGEKTSTANKNKEQDKETPVDLSQDNTNPVPGADAPMLWPAWVYCTRYSDRPSSGPRTRRSKNRDKNPEEKRPRTAFSGDQLSRLKHEFAENRYLTERRRQDLARELGLNEAQIKIWFQNKRAKMKKARGEKNPLALQLMAQGLYNHSTVPLTKEEEEAAAAELSD